ncbi:hypothetical protein N0V83_000338 [Neocucurbitaria cava]|uniref:Uncharacterized protein n=1 Tax=Neocucurbitaria cava TaxID=798079 RepID=A0A9W9CRW7_9PLEO|nr:hypothetical protein N0V83_000338 [Neocucurbitaria cava]
MKLQRFVGADSHVGSLVLSVKGRVAMRSAVVKQMKKPIEKRTISPMRDPVDMFRLKMTGIGRMKIDMSVKRLRTAFDQLQLESVDDLCCTYGSSTKSEVDFWVGEDVCPVLTDAKRITHRKSLCSSGYALKIMMGRQGRFRAGSYMDSSLTIRVSQQMELDEDREEI